MPVFKTEIKTALVTGHAHHFLLLTASFRTFICENLNKKKTKGYLFYLVILESAQLVDFFDELNSYFSLSLCRIRFAVSVDVFTDFNVRRLPSLDGDGDVAQRTYWDLDVL